MEVHAIGSNGVFVSCQCGFKAAVVSTRCFKNHKNCILFLDPFD